MLTIHLTLFGPAREFTGTDTLLVEMPEGATVKDLSAHLADQFPDWRAGIEVVRYAIGDAFVPGTRGLCEGDRVAVIPPVSGGMGQKSKDLIILTPDPLDIAHCYAHLAASSMGEGGGACVFVGNTRAETHSEHGILTHLAYEAHDSMALAQMHKLVDEARQRWSICSVVFGHRLGDVGIGESSVVIGVASGHRDESFLACRWLIDELKKEVPIWKREVWDSGAKSWSKSDSEKVQESEQG